MEDYYDFSGQKFGYPLSLSINGFNRKIFSRQNSLEISYVLKGEYEAVTEHFSCPVKEHELIIIAPGDIHVISQKGDEEGMILTIHIDFTRFSRAMAGEAEGAFQTILCTKEQNFAMLMKLRQKIGELVYLLQREEYDLFQMNAIMTELVYIASNHKQYPIEQLPFKSDHHENYRKAILYIDGHFKEELRLKDIAAALSFSESYTSRLFKKYTGMTFVRYLSGVRVRASLEALLEGVETIEKIAMDCGLPNSKAYTSTFKELYGIAPNTYRKRFLRNLRYGGDMTDQRMVITRQQKQLLEHLAEEAEEILYDNGAVKVTHQEGQIRCRIQTDEKVRSVITQEGKELVIEIIKEEDNR